MCKTVTKNSIFIVPVHLKYCTTYVVSEQQFLKNDKISLCQIPLEETKQLIDGTDFEEISQIIFVVENLNKVKMLYKDLLDVRGINTFVFLFPSVWYMFD